ncbi:Dihydrolipoyllysine-residue acetyltransferase component 3 of pyruvate dehydrogenase complex, partial [Paramuricea clavata]
LAAIVLATLPYSNASMFNNRPQFIIKAEKNKEFDKSCLIETFNIGSGNIADCLKHCLENCRCQSFQICDKTKCQLCSSHKKGNSSLLHDKDDCVYAMYEMRDLTETFQKLEGHCSGMNCPMKYNCCQQSGICPENKICKPVNSQEQPWKRFTCECPDGYHGDNCDQPITSCQGYAKGSRKSGMYKAVDSIVGLLYSVYCHFDSESAWTLVQSYSFANRSLGQFKKSLSNNRPISENALTWSGYRLSKARMESIK